MKRRSGEDAATERFSVFRLRHDDHKGELIHYVGSPCSIAEIERRLPKNHVTHIWQIGAWKKVERSER